MATDSPGGCKNIAARGIVVPLLGMERCKGLLEQILVLLGEALGEDLLAVACFGSIAMGRGGPTSDIDLFIVHRQGKQDPVAIFVPILMRLRRLPEYADLQKEGFLPDPYPIFCTQEHLKRHPWILLDIVDHGVILLDRGGVLKAELEQVRQRLLVLGSKKVVLPDGTWYWDLKPDCRPGEVFEL